MHPIKPQLVGKNLHELKDKNGVYLIKELINSAINNGKYINYVWDNPETKNAEDKIGYALGINDWKWMIGTGVYISDIENTIENKKNTQKEYLNKALLYIISVVVLIVLTASSFSFIALNKIKNIILKYNKRIENANEHLSYEVHLRTNELNENLEKRIEIEIQKNRDKDIKLLESSKLISMEELIGNIAHQWRQPLSLISTIASGIRFNIKMNLTNKPEDLDKNMKNIVDKIQYLSKIIDSFKDYINGNKEYANVNLQNEIDKTLHIIDVTFKNNNIAFQNNIDYSSPIIINTIPSELSEVMMNIFNNAKDMFILNQVSIPIITLDIDIFDNHITITIQDNGGGIPDDIMPKIFEPYFTTKHQSQGTGLGLHICHNIVNKNLNGKLYAKNTLEGAKFFIELSL